MILKICSFIICLTVSPVLLGAECFSVGTVPPRAVDHDQTVSFAASRTFDHRQIVSFAVSRFTGGYLLFLFCRSGFFTFGCFDGNGFFNFLLGFFPLFCDFFFLVIFPFFCLFPFSSFLSPSFLLSFCLFLFFRGCGIFAVLSRILSGRGLVFVRFFCLPDSAPFADSLCSQRRVCFLHCFWGRAGMAERKHLFSVRCFCLFTTVKLIPGDSRGLCRCSSAQVFCILLCPWCFLLHYFPLLPDILERIAFSVFFMLPRFIPFLRCEDAAGSAEAADILPNRELQPVNAGSVDCFE